MQVSEDDGRPLQGPELRIRELSEVAKQPVGIDFRRPKKCFRAGSRDVDHGASAIARVGPSAAEPFALHSFQQFTDARRRVASDLAELHSRNAVGLPWQVG